jgi:hypothetical protein
MPDYNPARQAMDKILGTVSPYGSNEPVSYNSLAAPQESIVSTTTPAASAAPVTSGVVSTAGEVFDPMKDLDKELADLKETNKQMAAKLGFGGASTDGNTGKTFAPGGERLWPVSTAQGGSAALPDWFRQAREWHEYWQKTPNGWIQLNRAQLTPSILEARQKGPDAIIPFDRGTGPSMDQRIGYLSAARDWEKANPGQTAPVSAYTGDAAAGKAQAIAAEAASRAANIYGR